MHYLLPQMYPCYWEMITLVMNLTYMMFIIKIYFLGTCQLNKTNNKITYKSLNYMW